MEQRLQKLIAAAGVASRRHAEELIVAGRVTVNGQVVKELGTKADPERDHIKVNGKLINPQLKSREKVYVLLNKPKGYLSSVSDPEGRPLATASRKFTKSKLRVCRRRMASNDCGAESPSTTAHAQRPQRSRCYTRLKPTPGTK